MALTHINELSTIRLVSSAFFLIWYLIVVIVAYRGFIEIVKNFKISPSLSVKDEEIEGVSILRPIKGIDPELESCLESSFLQNYPSKSLQILFCIDDPQDPSIPIIKKLIKKYPHISSEILVSPNFDTSSGTSLEHFGPNPKVNNLAKGFINAKFDILWIMDSNVWASSEVLRNSVKSLNEDYEIGRKLESKRKVKLVHHVPLALSISPNNNSDSEVKPDLVVPESSIKPKRFLKKLGAKLDEMFLLTSHSKFYIALNGLSIAPCVNGKSNIYRKSDLDEAVAKIPLHKSSFFNTGSVLSDARYYSGLGPGNSIKLFSRYIGEDNMIAIALWENLFSRTALTGDIVIQPLSGSDNSINDYITRRTRWLRVRKYMVLMATLIEPSTESIVCGLFGNYAISSIFFNSWFSPALFFIHILVWILTDYAQYYSFIMSIATFKVVPSWLIYENLPPLSRSFFSWVYIWLIREILALPIWIIAIFGHEIDWRGRPFKIKKDLTAAEL